MRDCLLGAASHVSALQYLKGCFREKRPCETCDTCVLESYSMQVDRELKSGRVSQRENASQPAPRLVCRRPEDANTRGERNHPPSRSDIYSCGTGQALPCAPSAGWRARAAPEMSCQRRCVVLACTLTTLARVQLRAHGLSAQLHRKL